MVNAYFSPSILILFFIILISSSYVASDQSTTNAPSLHDGDASTKLISTTISNAKTHFDSLKEVGNRRPFGGRKMKGDNESVMVQGSSSDNEEHVKILSAKNHYYISNVQGGDKKGDSKYEAKHSKQTKGGNRIHGREQKKTTTNDMDSYVSYADYPGPRHHPPKNN